MWWRSFKDPQIVHRLGNLTASSTSEVLGSARAYNEQGSQAQRSVKSSSVQDKPSGSGAKKVILVYLNSDYEEKTEEITLDGTTAVATAATDIRFVQDFYVSQGAAAAGAIELWTNTNGTGTAICGIGTGTEQAFLPHLYIPAGKSGWVLGWGATTDDECSFKLKGQKRPNGTDLVDWNLDLQKEFSASLTAPGKLDFYRAFPGGMGLPEKTYVRVNVIPGQATSTVIRTYLDVWVE